MKMKFGSSGIMERNENEIAAEPVYELWKGDSFRSWRAHTEVGRTNSK